MTDKGKRNAYVWHEKWNNYLVTLPVIFLLILFITGCAKENKAPAARAGYLDLSEWEFDRDGIVTLDGEWEFYWHKLLQPEDFASGKPPPKTGYFPIPGYWNGYKIDGRPLSGDGYATYRLTVKLRPGQDQLAIKSECIGGSYRIWADKDLTLWGGAMDKDHEAGTSRNFIHLFSRLPESGSGTLQIVFQVSNNIFHTGGPSRKISLGKASQITGQRIIYWSIDILLFGCLAIIGLYHIIFFILRQKDFSPLYFGCTCLLWCVELLILGAVRGNSLLITFFSYFFWSVLFRIELLVWYLFTPFMLMFISSLYPQESSRKAVRLFQGAALLFSLAAFIAPDRFLGRYAVFPYEMISFAGCLYAFFLLIRAVMKKRNGALIFVTGFFIFFLAALNDFLFINNIVYTYYLIPCGIAAMIFSQAFVLSMRFSRALSASESLSEELEKNLLLKTELLERKESEEKALILAEKETLLKLRYQLNPHFLFNALSSIRGAVGVNSDIAREMVTTLSEFCRLTLSHGETEALAIGEEVRLTRLYLRIEQIRLGDYLHVSIDAEPGVEEIIIPSFTLQPLVENALKYGKQTSPQRLDISVAITCRDQNRLILEVANSGRLMESKPASMGGSTGIGIENLRQRLNRFYSGDYTLSINAESGSVRVCIDVPAKRL